MTLTLTAVASLIYRLQAFRTHRPQKSLGQQLSRPLVDISTHVVHGVGALLGCAKCDSPRLARVGNGEAGGVLCHVSPLF